MYGVIFLFKYPTNEPPRPDTSTPLDGTYDHSASESHFFASQVIQNACGTQALLSVLLNKEGSPGTTSAPQDPQTIDVGEPLRAFKDFTLAFPADLRGESLSNSELIRDVHNSFARSSPFIDETQRQATDDDDVYHFIAYTPIAGALYELDGLQPAPISHGPCSFDEFPEKIVPVLQRRIARYPVTEIRFNLLAMTRDLRIAARERGDWEAVEREEAKRRGWMWENALRRHNFIGFAKEILMGVAAAKVKEGGYEGWVEDAKKATLRRIEARRAKSGGGAGAQDMDVDG